MKRSHFYIILLFTCWLFSCNNNQIEYTQLDPEEIKDIHARFQYVNAFTDKDHPNTIFLNLTLTQDNYLPVDSLYAVFSCPVGIALGDNAMLKRLVFYLSCGNTFEVEADSFNIITGIMSPISYKLADLNFDGQLDIKLNLEGGGRNINYQVFLQVPDSCTFKFHHQLSDLSNVRADISEKAIISTLSGGRHIGTSLQFIWEADSLQLRTQIEYDYSMDSTGCRIFYQHVLHNYKGRQFVFTDTLSEFAVSWDQADFFSPARMLDKIKFDKFPADGSLQIEFRSPLNLQKYTGRIISKSKDSYMFRLFDSTNDMPVSPEIELSKIDDIECKRDAAIWSYIDMNEQLEGNTYIVFKVPTSFSEVNLNGYSDFSRPVAYDITESRIDN